jgi:two-component system cell cycle sensor histidine kinase/response regulator CckA
MRAWKRSPASSGKDIDLGFFPGTDLWKVKLDPSYVRDHVDFTAGRFVFLTVSDSGTGMDREALSHLFEPFFTTKEIGKGTGIGLATVYGIVKQNGGFINVYSEPDLGSTFRIYFLMNEEDVAADEKSVGPPPSLGEGIVILVEDDDLVRNVTALELRTLGYDVIPFKTPAEAFAAFEKDEMRIVLLITDVVMPRMNGAELKKKIEELMPEIRVLFMSGYTANTIVHHGVLDPGVRFIQKPFTINELAVKVRDAIEG